MTIASAAHAAMPAFPASAALPSFPEGERGGAFASQLSGVTAEAVDADAWRSAATANPRHGAAFSLPMPIPRADSEQSSTAEDSSESVVKVLPSAQIATPAAAEDPIPPERAEETNFAAKAPAVPAAEYAALPPEMASAATVASASLTGSGGRFSLQKSTPKAAGTPKPAISGRSSIPRASSRPSAGPEPETATAVAAPSALQIAATTAAATDDPATENDPENAVKPAAPHGAPAEAAESAQPLVTAAGASAHPAQEMAFAAKVQPVQGAEHAGLPAEMASTAAVASASRKVVAADDQSASPADSHGMPATATASLERSVEPASTAASPADSAHSATNSAAHLADVSRPSAEGLPKPSAPLKDISMQVTQPGKEPVDVRVVQQGGEVHISVHSADAGVTSGLRQNLSELQSKLEENGYRSEMWRPGISATPTAAAPTAQASPNQSRGGNDGQPQQGGSQQESGRRNPNQSNQPHWVEELESSLGSGEKSSGGFYGFGS